MKHDHARIPNTPLMDDLSVPFRLSASRILRVFGMRRSGNHAVINWLLRNAPSDGAVFFNNCNPKRNPLTHHAAVEIFWQGAKLPRRQKAALSQELINAAGHRPLVIQSYEDVMPTRSTPDVLDDGQDIIVYRSFLNWSASLLRKLQRNTGQGPIWRLGVLCRACKVYACMLEQVEQGARAVLYDQWMTEPTYRETVLSEIGFPCRDNSLGEVQRYGGGSSFQPDARKVQALNVQSRADEMMADAEYRRFLETVISDRRIFARVSDHFGEDMRRMLQTIRRNPTLAWGGAQ